MAYSGVHTQTIQSVRARVFDVFAAIAGEQGKKLLSLSDSTPLMDSGLDSLCIAIIVARLDYELGVDPFGSIDDLTLPVTVGDFIQIYEHAAA